LGEMHEHQSEEFVLGGEHLPAAPTVIPGSHVTTKSASVKRFSSLTR
jgi:hypothetical protein